MPSRPPHPALLPYVSSMVGYHDVLDPQAVHHGLPEPTMTVILAFETPLDVGWLADRGRHDRYWTCAAGLHAAPALIRTHGYQHGIQLALTPLGARVLLGLPAGALGGTMADHDALPVGIGADVHARLAALDDWERRFDLLERHLLDRVARHGDEASARIRPEAAEAWRTIQASRGRVRVEAVADRIGWSRRRLLDRFRAEFGVSPKQAARITRFDHARLLVDSGRELGEVAVIAGYSDQAHLTREWVALAGRTPTQVRDSPYHPDVVPFVQDTRGVVGADFSA